MLWTCTTCDTTKEGDTEGMLTTLKESLPMEDEKKTGIVGSGLINQLTFVSDFHSLPPSPNCKVCSKPNMLPEVLKGNPQPNGSPRAGG